MDIHQIYDYLMRACRDLWATLEAVPDEVLIKPLLNGRFHCIKDFLYHIPMVEDGWIHCTILNDEPVLDSFSTLKDLGDSPDCAQLELGVLLDYWRAVEQSTLKYLSALTDAELQRVVQDSPTDFFAVRFMPQTECKRDAVATSRSPVPVRARLAHAARLAPPRRASPSPGLGENRDRPLPGLTGAAVAQSCEGTCPPPPPPPSNYPPLSGVPLQDVIAWCSASE